jgi:hypothetical protein
LFLRRKNKKSPATYAKNIHHKGRKNNLRGTTQFQQKNLPFISIHNADKPSDSNKRFLKNRHRKKSEAEKIKQSCRSFRIRWATFGKPRRGLAPPVRSLKAEKIPTPPKEAKT